MASRIEVIQNHCKVNFESMPIILSKSMCRLALLKVKMLRRSQGEREYTCLVRAKCCEENFMPKVGIHITHEECLFDIPDVSKWRTVLRIHTSKMSSIRSQCISCVILPPAI